MATALILEDQIEIPLSIGTLESFRCWALSDAFPEHGRIDFIGGRIEVDMSPEDLFAHGTLKTEIVYVIAGIIKQHHLGHLFTDTTRISSVDAELSAEPDVVFLSEAAIDSGRVRLVPKASGDAHRYVEIEGGPDLVVEIASDSSVKKDTERLPVAYFNAGVSEFWLVDARGDELVFRIHHRGTAAFEMTTPDEDGFQRSNVLGVAFRLDRRRDAKGRPAYDLVVRGSA